MHIRTDPRPISFYLAGEQAACDPDASAPTTIGRHSRRDKRDHVGREQALDHQDVPAGTVHRRPIHPPKVPEDSAAEVGDVVRAAILGPSTPLNRSSAGEDRRTGSLGTDQRFKLPLDLAG